MLAAEKRLSVILGPVAPFILESAVQDSNDAGELFARLAAELSDQDERDYLFVHYRTQNGVIMSQIFCEVVVFDSDLIQVA